MIDIQNDDNMGVLAGRLKDPDNIVAVGLLKEASIDVDFSDLVDESFADQENRKFPIFSPEFATISAMHMQTQDVDPLVKEACDNALSDWGIEGVSTDCAYNKEEVGIPHDRFLMPHKLKFPVIDEESLEKSASALDSVLDSLSMPEKMVASKKLYKFATEEYGMDPGDLSGDVIRYAQQSPCDLNKLASSVSERYAETHNDKYQDFIAKIASLKEDIGGSVSFDTSTNSGIGLDLFRIDQESGVENSYDAIYDTFNAPFMIDTNRDIEKVATIATVNIGGYDILEDSLLKMAASELEDTYPGLSAEVFAGDSLSIDKLIDFAEEVTPSAANVIGKFLSER